MKLVIQKLILLKTCVVILWNIDNYQSIYVNFSIFFWMLQVKTLHKTKSFFKIELRGNMLFLCILNIYVKHRYITAQEVPLLEFHIPSFCDRHIFSLFVRACPIFIVLQWNFHHLDAQFFYLTN